MVVVVRVSGQKRKFPLGWLVIGLAVGGAIYWGPGLLGKGGKPPEAAQAEGMPASVASVISENVAPWSEFSGRIEAMGDVEIRPQVGGQITQVLFKDGSDVKRGQPLFTIDPRPYEAEMNRARGAYASAQSAAENARQNFARVQKLVKSKAVSQSEFEASKSALAQAEGALATAKGALQAAEVNLGYAHIVAPISGKISRAEITEGNLVQAGPNAPLLASIVKLSPIYASFELDEQTFLKTIQGVTPDKLKNVPVEVQLSGSDKAISAKVHSFDNQIAAGSGTIRVRAVIENKDGALVPGLFAKVRLAAPEQVASVLIHPTTVGTDQSKKFVLVVNKENKTEYREVKLGPLYDGLQIVTAGLEPGERIVAAGLQRMRPGMPVTPKEVDMRTLKPLAPEAGSETPAAPAEGAPAAPEAAADAPAETAK